MRLVYQEPVAGGRRDQQGPYESHPRLPSDKARDDMLSCRLSSIGAAACYEGSPVARITSWRRCW
jgi:hypothetical protein